MTRAGITLALILFGCASQKPAQTQAPKKDAAYASAGQAKPKGTMHCHMEQDTGSNRMERVCTYEETKAQAEDKTLDDAMLQMEKRALQHVSPGMGGSGQ